jgi:hypothetical protein
VEVTDHINFRSKHTQQTTVGAQPPVPASSYVKGDRQRSLTSKTSTEILSDSDDPSTKPLVTIRQATFKPEGGRQSTPSPTKGLLSAGGSKAKALGTSAPRTELVKPSPTPRPPDVWKESSEGAANNPNSDMMSEKGEPSTVAGKSLSVAQSDIARKARFDPPAKEQTSDSETESKPQNVKSTPDLEKKISRSGTDNSQIRLRRAMGRVSTLKNPHELPGKEILWYDNRNERYRSSPKSWFDWSPMTNDPKSYTKTGIKGMSTLRVMQ